MNVNLSAFVIWARDTFYISMDCICVARERFISRAAPLGTASLTARKVSDEWKELCKLHAFASDNIALQLARRARYLP